MQPLARERILLELRPLDLRGEHAIAVVRRASSASMYAASSSASTPKRAASRATVCVRKYSCGTPSPALIICRHNRYEPERGGCR